jgi:hypothetical protein
MTTHSALASAICCHLLQVSREVLANMQTIFRDLLAAAVNSSSQAAGQLDGRS